MYVEHPRSPGDPRRISVVSGRRSSIKRRLVSRTVASNWVLSYQERHQVPLLYINAHSLRSRPRYAKRTWKKRSVIFIVRPTVHTNPSRKRSFSRALFKPEEFEKAGFFVLVWTENISKTVLFESDVVTIAIWFPCPSFSQTQIQNNRWLLRF